MFLDNCTILADMDTEASVALYDIACFAEPYGLKFNIDETKVMMTDGSPASVKIEQVQNFK